MTGHWPLSSALAAAMILAAAPSVRAEGDVEYGEYLSSACVTCHQLDGDSEGIPPIIGWTEEHFVEVMVEFRDGVRQHDVMKTIAGRYTEEELLALAAYFAALEAADGG